MSLTNSRDEASIISIKNFTSSMFLNKTYLSGGMPTDCYHYVITDVNNPLSHWYTCTFFNVMPQEKDRFIAENNEDALVRFINMDHYMEWQRALYFNDFKMAAQIAYTYGSGRDNYRQWYVQKYSPSQWTLVKYKIMLEGLRLKCAWVPAFKDALMNREDIDVIFMDSCTFNDEFCISDFTGRKNETYVRGLCNIGLRGLLESKRQNMGGFLLTQLRCEMLGREPKWWPDVNVDPVPITIAEALSAERLPDGTPWDVTTYSDDDIKSYELRLYAKQHQHQRLHMLRARPDLQNEAINNANNNDEDDDDLARALENIRDNDEDDL